MRWLQAGEASGASLAEGIHRERGHFFDRRASDDEVLLLRAAYGLGVYVR